MRTILVIGIGAGDPEHMTVQAIKALNRADVIFLPDKGDDKDGLQKLRRDICARFLEKPGVRFAETRLPERDIAATPDYKANIDTWRAGVAAGYERFIAEDVADGECGAFLVWGDPAIYDGTLRILAEIAAEGAVAFDYEAIPGISSVAALAARHRVPLNGVGEAIQITTGRRLEAGWPADAENLVVMLDGRQAYARLADEDVEIFWGAYVGTPDEILISGRLADVKGRIAEAQAAARAKHGWIMDSYILRRRKPRG
ncbi:MAG: precorrin-6A synthase (deacetylating) [Alphaproteobacteria bacterium]